MPNPNVTILIADDDVEDLELVEDAILNEDPGLRLYKVTNGAAALDYLARQADNELPCLIILDYNMPELSGLEVLVQICSENRYKSIPKVILSTSSTPAHIQECIKNGATEYFVKPDSMKGMHALAVKMLSLCKKSP